MKFYMHRYALRTWLAPLLIIALTMPAALCLCSDHAFAAAEQAATDTPCCKGDAKHEQEEQGEDKGCCGASALACTCAQSLLQADFQPVALAPAVVPSISDSIVAVVASFPVAAPVPRIARPCPEYPRTTSSRPLHQVLCVQIC